MKEVAHSDIIGGKVATVLDRIELVQYVVLF